MKFLIDFENTATSDEITSYFTINQCQVIKEYQHFEKVFLVESDSNPPKTSIVTSVVNDDQAILTLLDTNIVDNTLEYTLIDAEDEKNWWKIYTCAEFSFENTNISIPKRGTKSKVYILDSGINKNHSEFVGVNINELYSVVENFDDTTGHGTAIASIISGNACGLTKSKLNICKIFDTSHQTKQSELLAAFDAVLTDFNTTPNIPGVVNLSWSIPRNSFIEDKIKVLRNRGLIVVVAAGNSGMPIDNITPASMDDVLTIGSYNQNFDPSNFSSYTDSVVSVTNNETNHGALDGWAPGERIYVARPDGSFGFAGGTSLSAAIHTASVAYNLDIFYLDNSLIPCMDLSQIDRVSDLSLKRENFLNLNDIKYSNSINKISTVFNRPATFTVLRQFKNTTFEFNFPVREENTKCRLLFNPENTKSFELLDPLPNGFSIINGWLIGVAPTITDNFQLYTSKLRLVTLEPEETIEITLNLSFVKSTLTKEDLPADDPAINIVFSVYCGEQDCFGPYQLCNGSCPLFQQNCTCIDLKAFACGCTE